MHNSCDAFLIYTFYMHFCPIRIEFILIIDSEYFISFIWVWVFMLDSLVPSFKEFVAESIVNFTKKTFVRNRVIKGRKKDFKYISKILCCKHLYTNFCYSQHSLLLINCSLPEWSSKRQFTIVLELRKWYTLYDVTHYPRKIVMFSMLLTD